MPEQRHFLLKFTTLAGERGEIYLHVGVGKHSGPSWSHTGPEPFPIDLYLNFLDLLAEPPFFSQASTAIGLELEKLGCQLENIQRIEAVENRITNDVKRSHRADHYLIGVARRIPRRHREFWVGDIREDVREMREAGATEKELITHIRWQLAWVAIERLYVLVRPDRWAWASAAAWVINKFRG